MGSVILEAGSHRKLLGSLLEETRGVVRIASAYVTESDPFEGVGNRDIRLLTALNPMDVISGATSLDALKRLIEKGIDCRIAPQEPKLHAKVYIFGHESALVTSANLTRSGLDSNAEIGALVSKNEIRDLVRWFDRQWSSATRIDDSKIDEWEQRYAAARREYSDLQAKFRQQPPAHPPYGSQVPSSVSFFLCNTNRRYDPSPDHRHLEELMKQRGFAAAWTEFHSPAHMQRVQRGDVILLFASGLVGIIAIGRAKGPVDVVDTGDPRRLYGGFGDPEEWRIPVDWIKWVEDEKGYRWEGGRLPTFVNISDEKYRSKREAALQLLLGDHWRDLVGARL